MVGESLKNAREAQGLSIKDIEDGTNIRASYLEAIEKGDYGALPSEVYVRGFIRNYANFLKLDAEAIVLQFKEELHPGTVSLEAKLGSNQGNGESGTAAYGSADSGSDGESSRSSKLMIGVLIALIVAGGAWFYSNGSMGEKAEVSRKATTAKPVSKEPAQESGLSVEVTLAPEEKTDTAAAADQEAAVSEDLVLQASFKDSCWVQVTVDDQLVFEGTGEAGQVMEWKAKHYVFILAGNAGALEITRNGENLGPMGDPGTTVETVFSKDH